MMESRLPWLWTYALECDVEGLGTFRVYKG